MPNDMIYTAADIAEYYEMALQHSARELEDLLDTYGPESENRDKFLRLLVKHWREIKMPGRREDTDNG